jgi:beta-glucosidase
VSVSVRVTNSGTRRGDEVVQFYVEHLGSAVERPIKELKGYRRLTLNPGETQTVRFPLAASQLAYWHERDDRWVVERERVQLLVGASSADIRLDKTMNVVAGR